MRVLNKNNIAIMYTNTIIAYIHPKIPRSITQKHNKYICFFPQFALYLYCIFVLAFCIACCIGFLGSTP